MTIALLIGVILLLAAANGGNDNIKGAVTLVGSGMMGFRTAIAFATLATALGGVASIYLANGLLQAFTGKGFVPVAVTSSHGFLLAVAAGAAIAIWLATWRGLPISTTHALLGGLLGAGFAYAPNQVDLSTALTGMLLPLLLSPMLALLLAIMLVPHVRKTSAYAGDTDPCLCIGPDLTTISSGTTAACARVIISDSRSEVCQPENVRSVLALPLRNWRDHVHLLSAAAVSFARGLNDTPKIAALVVAGSSLGAGSASLLVVLAMALGGLLAARRVSETLAFKVTRMDSSEGFAANMVTAALVIGASRFGMPVSTTHVSTGALFGIAAGNGSGKVL